MKCLVILAVLSVAFSLETFTDSPPEAIPNYNLNTISLPIDHYAATSANFSLRYYTRTDYYAATKTGPIFFYCGGEASIEIYINNTGFIDQLANTLDAVVVYAEHRYFGQSLPFGDQSYSSEYNRKFLSPHQALADFAYLLNYLQGSYFNVPVIVWGGGYSGMLSAWFRMKYPHLVTGSIASSAPIFLFNGTADPYEYNRLLTQVYSAMGGSGCPAVIKTAFDFLEQNLNNISTYFQIQNDFNTCQDIITGDDVAAVMQWVYNGLNVMALHDYTSSSNFGQQLPANPVTAACNIITTVLDLTDIDEVFEYLAAGVNLYYNSSGTQTCNDLDYASSSGFGYTGRDFLECTTVCQPLGTNGKTDMFWDNPWDQVAYDSYCLQTYGEATNVNYAALWYGNSLNQSYVLRHASNIVFTSGSIDPYQAGSYLMNYNPNLIAFVMQGAAHYAELRKPNLNDPSEVVSGRGIITQAIQYWLSGTIS